MGGVGADVLVGGSGSDTFRYVSAFESRAGGFDTIFDFASGSDKIFVAPSGTTKFQVTGLASVSALVPANTIAWFHDTANNQTIVYGNNTSGTLNGGSPSLLEVHLTGVSSVGIGDFTPTLTAAPAGVAGEPINLGLAAPLAADGTSFTVDVAGLSSGWSLDGGTQLQSGIWTTQTADLRSLTVTSPRDFIGATALSIMASWSGSDGVALATTINDNVEVFQPGSPIFAWAGEDHLTGSSGQDLFVFAQPIQHDTVYSFDPQLDQIDLTGFTGLSSFADLQDHLSADTAGNSLITLADGQTITVEGVP